MITDTPVTSGIPGLFKDNEALDILEQQRRFLGRGLSCAEKILLLHQSRSSVNQNPTNSRARFRLIPDRVAMQDATAQMAMLQFMQSGRERVTVEASIHCDHLIKAEKGAEEDLLEAENFNREIYDFLSSTAAKYGLGFWKPGSGIIHQVVLENYATPGSMMIGTDSHTPNAGGLGVLAIGVGGADAAEVMAGLEWEMLAPGLVGVKLSGHLTGWATAKDVAFEMLKRYGVKGGTGKIFEYFGPGAETLSTSQKATITNMGAELGATSSLFVYDESMDTFLRCVGRSSDADRALASRKMFTQDEACLHEPGKVYDEFIEIDLKEIKPAHSGPFSPDLITRVSDFDKMIPKAELPDGASAVLLGSCTNSSYSDLYAVSEILEEAASHGLSPRIPVLLSPGSQQVFETIKRDKILDRLERSGVLILASACGPCIGQWNRQDSPTGTINCIFTTYNRNFRARNDGNPQTRAVLTSPPMAAAIAVAGRTDFDPERDYLKGKDGIPFKLSPPGPPSLPDKGMSPAGSCHVQPEDHDKEIVIRIDPSSERLQRIEPFAEWDGRDFLDLPVLIKTLGKTTTDHISPGGIWLKYRGHLTNISRNILLGATNAFTGETGVGTNVLTGEKGCSLYEIAAYYRDHAGGFVIVGDENYGEGSSREHAAMTPRFMGAKVVIAKSFARIHEANLKKQGILPLRFSDPSDYKIIQENSRLSFIGITRLRPGSDINCIIREKDRARTKITLNHTMTWEQIDWFKAGSSLNTISSRPPGLSRVISKRGSK